MNPDHGTERLSKAAATQKSPSRKLPHRFRLLLALLQVFGGRMRAGDFQKYLFLHEKELTAKPVYDFVPYRYGAFSFQSYADRRRLIAAGLILEKEDWQLANCSDFLGNLPEAQRLSLSKLKRKYGHLAGRRLIRETYQRFPYYAIRSEIAHDLLDQEGLANIESERPQADSECLFTIGYEGISLDTYINRLVRNNIRVLCDVRKNPLSRKYGFSKRTLSDTVEELGIRYVHVPELGIDSAERRQLTTRQDYDCLFAHYEQTTLRKARPAITMLANLLTEYKRIALTCFEADANLCHRSRVAGSLSRLPRPPAATKHV